ncbi:quercetin dioxygenase-like cupin family protein [Mucilaginibacter gracilis]|uniref:Quercetin dioxygenase-like cupin family protein n=1 Tax=Mucilaginibacter gracilis TaxID=423350 RepID=A0A495JAA1_9SPHI|nr:cupin domain-containing protein [Mucilaginibacter gracilis]RKR85282.1 quercetin dioxygenase-like cupin family protein [Mucilaginibacter gracilis]
MSKLNSKTFLAESEVEWQNQGGGVQRQIFGYNAQMMMAKAKFEKGAIGALHSHPHTQVAYVAGGVFEVTIGDEKRILKDGDGFYVAPNVVHGVVCLEAGTLVDAFSPMREDFI